jgi:thymidylate kinase
MKTRLVTAETLFEKLNEQGIKYCHWKSNRNLDRGLRGLTDLDLLVERRQRRCFKTTVHQLGCKTILSSPSKQYPAVEDYLGCDENTGQLFHLHVHYQLILGERFVKNHRLPLEREFLESARISDGIKIVSPELEVIVLAMRALLKYRDRDVVKDVLSIGSPGLPLNILQEFEYLLQKTSFERIETVLEEEVNFVSPDVVLGFLKAVAESPRSGYKFYQMRRDLRHDLAAYQRYGRWKATARYFYGLHGYRLPFGRSFLARKKLTSGGMLIALVGADGAGKSTIVAELHKWLSWKLDVHVCYMGTGEQISHLSRALRFSSENFARLHRLCSVVVGAKHGLFRISRQVYRFTRHVYHLSIALIRYRRYVAARRKAAQGSIVICDRYPLEGIHRVMRGTRPPMDGPRIAWMCRGEETEGITAHLSKLEQKIYERIGLPDCLILLHVSPNIALQRKPDHTPEKIEPKIQAVERMDRQGLQIIDIDADQPFERTSLQTKSALWNIL